MTWFQRHEEPKVSSDDYEEGIKIFTFKYLIYLINFVSNTDKYI